MTQQLILVYLVVQTKAEPLAETDEPELNLQVAALVELEGMRSLGFEYQCTCRAQDMNPKISQEWRASRTRALSLTRLYQSMHWRIQTLSSRAYSMLQAGLWAFALVSPHDNDC